jgi:hypothetical protein
MLSDVFEEQEILNVE